MDALLECQGDEDSRAHKVAEVGEEQTQEHWRNGTGELWVGEGKVEGTCLRKGKGAIDSETNRTMTCSMLEITQITEGLWGCYRVDSIPFSGHSSASYHQHSCLQKRHSISC